jgi:uncharacterized membrane protein (Fun14 family)
MATLGVGFDLKKAIVIVLLLIIGAFFLGYSAGYKAAKSEAPDNGHRRFSDVS